MFKKILIITLSTLASILVFSGVLSAQNWVVSPKGNLNSVTEAIAKASSGDTITITEGVYFETGVVVDKPLTIIGEGKAIIDGQEDGFVVIVRSDSVTLKNFEIHNSGTSFIDDYAGLLVEKSQNVVLDGLTLADNFFGIYLSQSANVLIQNNTITASGLKETSSGNGVHLWYSKNVHVQNNTVTGHRDGFYFEFVEEVEVVNNLSHNNLRYGLHFMFSNNCSYSHNEISNNGAGVAVMYTSKVKIRNNNFKDNWGSAAYGLLLKEINESEIVDNNFSNNSVGLYMESSNRNNIFDNTFIQNGWAIKLMANSMDNVFTDNNFFANTFEVTTNSKQNFNLFEANYWSHYEGYDLDKDGFGDVPHRPVRLFSVVVQKHPQALILLRSTLIDLLDATEKFLPVITPDKLIDAKPRMREKL
ncbi:MAG: nitrous oxide reductase family maturation protein NosD [Balneolaceae bacterium]